jgi:hypothetical protein
VPRDGGMPQRDRELSLEQPPRQEKPPEPDQLSFREASEKGKKKGFRIKNNRPVFVFKNKD